MGLGKQPNLAQDGIRQARLLVSADQILGSEARFSFTSYHGLLSLISDFGWSPGAVSQGVVPMAVGTESCLHRPEFLAQLGVTGYLPLDSWLQKVSCEYACILCKAMQAESPSGSSRGPSLPPRVVLCHPRTSAAASPGREIPALTTHLPAHGPAPAAPAQALVHCPIRVSCRLHGAPRMQLRLHRAV